MTADDGDISHGVLDQFLVSIWNTSPTTSSGAWLVPASILFTRSSVGSIMGNPSVHPLS